MDLDYLVGFDTETTGISPVDDRIVTASIVCLAPDNSVYSAHEWLINPGIPIPDEAAAVHGVSTAQAEAEGVDPAIAVLDIAKYLQAYLQQGIPVVAYNAAFDFSILNAEIKRYTYLNGFSDLFDDPALMKNIIDPYVIDKKVDRYRKGRRTLTDSAKLYGVSLENAHASYDDCIAAVGVARALWDKYPALAEGDPERLYEAQAQWYREQQEGLAAYFKKQGKDADVNTVWPINTL